MNTYYVFDQSQQYLLSGNPADPINFELSGTGYVRKFMPDRSLAVDQVSGVIRFLAGLLFYPEIRTDEDAGGAIIYSAGADDMTSALLLYVSSGFPIPLYGNKLSINGQNGVWCYL
ncbi:MAG: hypothetical protein AB1611_09280 [bacterium]